MDEAERGSKFLTTQRGDRSHSGSPQLRKNLSTMRVHTGGMPLSAAKPLKQPGGVGGGGQG
jgi:hypothetical protein